MFDSHAYPELPEPLPVFMFGAFDRHAAETGTALALNKAILGIHQDEQGLITGPHIHRHAGPVAGLSDAFMFGVHAEQPCVPATDQQIVNAWFAHHA